MAIVRGKVTSYASFGGPIIYTHCEVQVSEQLKGTSGSSLDVVVPGGTANNLRQINSGAPQLDLGRRVCVVSMDGASGLTQIMGLTQGLFRLSTGGLIERGGDTELMLEAGTSRRIGVKHWS